QVWAAVEAHHIEALREHIDQGLAHRVALVDLNALDRHPLHNQFERTTKLPLEQEGFWRYTTERFFVLLDLASQYKLENVVHLESDVLIYSNVTEIITKRRGTAQILFPLDKRRGYGSVLYFTDARAIERLCAYALSAPLQNDMDMLGAFYDLYQGYGVESLPTVPTSICLAEGLDVRRYARPDEENWGLFDGAYLGQYVGGIDPIHDRRVLTGFVNENAPVDPHKLGLAWRYEEGKPSLISTTANNQPIHNLHIHSKRTFAYTTGSDHHLIDEKTGRRLLRTSFLRLPTSIGSYLYTAICSNFSPLISPPSWSAPTLSWYIIRM
ncbi:MAG: hypothetical protein EB072_21500, partial [Betaproteobacteria bacterium]|nr:hypothetical protein [Betaproteobacteria bacterium]